MPALEQLVRKGDKACQTCYRRFLALLTARFSVGASLLAKNVNDNACFQDARGAYGFFASKLAPTHGIGARSGGEKIGFHVHPGVAHLRQLVAQGARADAQALGRFFAAAAFGAQGVDDHLEFTAAQVIAQGTG